MEKASKTELATFLAALIERHAAAPPIKRLRMRVRDLGADRHDEVSQFRQLQKACRELPALGDALREAGFGDVALIDARVPDPKTGALVQAFNHFIEARWED